MPNIVTIMLEDVKQDFILNAKTFKTGSTGFHAQGKLQKGESRFQVNIILTLIGSGPHSKAKK